MLYRTWAGRSSDFFRWKMHAQMIIPHTTTPTAIAAIQEPCHRCSMTTPCLVTGLGSPRRVNRLFVQPDKAITSKARPAAYTARRRRLVLRRIGLTDGLPRD